MATFTGGTGNDTFNGTDDPDTMNGNDGSDQLHGNGGDDHLFGGDGPDYHNGGAGDDTMAGGLGDDGYEVDSYGDVVTELAGEGYDNIRTTLPVYSLFGTQIERLTGYSSTHGHDFRGSTADNWITGYRGDDFIRLQDGGNDRAAGMWGNDVFLLGASWNGGDEIRGDDGIDQVVFQGNYSGANMVSLGTTIGSVENFVLLPGNDTRFGDPGTGFYDYHIVTINRTVQAGVQLVVDANALRPGEDLTFDGSAEADGRFFIYGGGGTDILTGGADRDVFIFGGQNQWGASDIVVGGGEIDQLALRGNYTIVFGANQMVDVEQIGMVSAQDTRYGPLGSSYSYDLTMNDGNVVGIQMTVDAAPLRPGETLTFNGSAEDDGSFRVFGGRGADTIVGSQNADILVGNAGADDLTGGSGGDEFRYVASLDSAPGEADHILDFTSGSDWIELSRVDADTNTAGNQAFRWIGPLPFTGTGPASAGELRAYQDVGGSWFVEGDTDGDGDADLVIEVTTPTPLTADNFVL